MYSVNEKYPFSYLFGSRHVIVNNTLHLKKALYQRIRIYKLKSRCIYIKCNFQSYNFVTIIFLRIRSNLNKKIQIHFICTNIKKFYFTFSIYCFIQNHSFHPRFLEHPAISTTISAMYLLYNCISYIRTYICMYNILAYIFVIKIFSLFQYY